MADAGPPTPFSVAKPSFGWLTETAMEKLTSFQRSFCERKWENTALGPIEGWSAQLSKSVVLAIADTSPVALCWRTNSPLPSNTIIQNEAYTNILDPRLAPATTGIMDLAEDWYAIEDLFSRQLQDEQTIVLPTRLVLRNKEGTLEEAYFTWRFMPLFNSDGTICATYCTGTDATQEVVAKRRLDLVSSLGLAVAKPEDITWSHILQGLQHDPQDIPLALLYSVDHATSAPRTMPAAERPIFSTQPLTCTLEGTVGNPVELLEVPVTFYLSQNDSWLATSFKRAIEAGHTVIVSKEDGTLPLRVPNGHGESGQGAMPSKMVICPLYNDRLGPVRAFLVLALSSWRPYDDGFQTFIQTLTNQIGPSQIAAATTNDETRKRGLSSDSDVSERATLARELRTKTLELEEGAKTLGRFTARAQVALGILDAKGSVVFANPLWRDLTRLEPADDQVAWAKAIIPEDLEQTYQVFARMVSERAPIDFHLRFNKRWQAPESDMDGNPILTDTHIICNLFPDLDDEGNVSTIMSCLTDISELKWVESRLRLRTVEVENREAMWRTFADAAPIGLALLNPDGTLKFGNETWWAMTQTPGGEKSGLSWISKVVLHEDVSQVEQMFLSSLEHNAPQTMEFRLNQLAHRSHPKIPEHTTVGKDTNTTILCTLHTTFDANNAIQHVVAWMTDITSQKVAETNIRDRMDQAIHLKKQQGKFIDMTSHELRNPLSALVHCADEIVCALDKFLVTRQDSLVDDALQAADTIIYCTKFVERITSDILTLSRLDSDLLVISPQPAIPSTTIQHALKVFELELKSADISVTLQDQDPLLSTWMLFDSARFLQIFFNFMTNAIKFTRNQEKRHITIQISASSTTPIDERVKYIPKKAILREQTTGPDWGDGQMLYLSLSVADTGKGLTEEEKARLFNVFQQASPKTHIQYGGSGLGLFISRQLVEMQGGEVGVASEAGHGSVFSCYIKTTRTEAPPETSPTQTITPSFMDAEALREASGGEHSSRRNHVIPLTASQVQPPADIPLGDSTNVPKLHILVVEDNQLNARVLKKGLVRHDCAVSVANHGVEALDFIEKSEYHTDNGSPLSVILMDLEMPVMDGLTCIRKIREGQARGEIRGHIPTIAITANAREDQVAEAMDAGMDAVVTKPYRIPEIVSQVEALLARLQE